MGLKIRLGLALSGLLMSSMFGVNLLTGIKDYVDTTGNIMVDIADGIGMVSKGIEYLEFYLDPDAAANTDEGTPSTDPSASPPDPAATPAPTVVKPSSGEVPGSPDQPAVICQKGKCYPYDPNRVKNPNINLEMKPGMILTPQAPQGKQGKQQRKRSEEEDDEELENRKRNAAKKARSSVSTPSTASTTPSSSTTSSSLSTTATTSTTTSTASANQESEDKNVSASKKILTAVRGLLDNTSKLIVRLVSRMFPWNRRARRRLSGEEDEL